MGSLAAELASVGQMDAAVEWYKRSFELAQQLGLGWDAGRYLDYAASLQILGQPAKADEAASSVFNANPSNARAATLRLLIARQVVNAPLPGSAPADVQYLKLRTASRARVDHRATRLDARAVNGANAAAATQPAATQPADLIGLIEADSQRLRQFYDAPANDTQKDFLENDVASLTNLVWYYTYFDPQPPKADRLLAVLKPLRATDDVEVTRLEGFAFLASGKKDEAKVKFSAVADKDPLAKMGLILLDPAAPGAADDASKLVSQNPSGILGATLIDGLRNKGGKFVPDSVSVAAGAARARSRLECSICSCRVGRAISTACWRCRCTPPIVSTTPCS